MRTMRSLRKALGFQKQTLLLPLLAPKLVSASRSEDKTGILLQRDLFARRRWTFSGKQIPMYRLSTAAVRSLLLEATSASLPFLVSSDWAQEHLYRQASSSIPGKRITALFRRRAAAENIP